MAAARARCPPADAQRQGQRLTQFSKTKLCKFELLGMCSKGPECPFAHGQEEVRPLPDLRKTKLCAVMMRTGRCMKEDCTFAHTKEELRAAGMSEKAKFDYYSGTGGHDASNYSGYEYMSSSASADEVCNDQVEDSSPLRFMAPSPFIFQKQPKPEISTSPVGATDIAVPRRVVLKAKNPFARGIGALSPTEPAYVPVPGTVPVEPLDDFWKVQNSWTSESTLCTLGDRPDSGAVGVDFSFAEGIPSVFGLPAPVLVPMRVAV